MDSGGFRPRVGRCSPEVYEEAMVSHEMIVYEVEALRPAESSPNPDLTIATDTA